MLVWRLLRIKSRILPESCACFYRCRFNFMFFCFIFQLQDCIQATLSDWFSMTKPPSTVGTRLRSVIFLLSHSATVFSLWENSRSPNSISPRILFALTAHYGLTCSYTTMSYCAVRQQDSSAWESKITVVMNIKVCL